MQDLGRDSIHDRRNHATKPGKQSNKIPLPISNDDIWRYDIEYGVGTTIRGIKYALIITARVNRYTFAYPLKVLKDSSLLSPMKLFVSHLGRKPKKMFTERDLKVIGGVVAEFLERNDNPSSTEPISQVIGVPTNRQNQNGLTKFRWKIYSASQAIG